MNGSRQFTPPPAAFGSSQYVQGPPVATAAIGGNPDADRAIRFAVASLLCGAFLAPFALVFGVKGLKAADRLAGEGKGKAIAAIAICSTQLALVLVLLSMAALGSAGGAG
jgi:hypothetical protein